jgi:hypothetical protein
MREEKDVDPLVVLDLPGETAREWGRSPKQRKEIRDRCMRRHSRDFGPHGYCADSSHQQDDGQHPGQPPAR